MILPRYPIYIPSKGRADRFLTARFLVRDGVPFKVVVEPQERAVYEDAVGPRNVLVLPFANLGLGSIPARNWIKDHATASGYARHWIVDDNIMGMWRRFRSRKIRCESGVAYRTVEDFADRYSNIAIAGHNYYMFAPDKYSIPPFVANVHVYSSILLSNSIPHRWRGRYNEDTDLCLQVLADGWCTILVNAFLAWKETTMKSAGGNTDELYTGDGRLRMARELERRWPGVVPVKRRFGRPQHVIFDAWGRFDTPLKRREPHEIPPGALEFSGEYGMELRQVAPIRSDRLRELVADRLAGET